MRNISPASLAKLQEKTGTEPIVIVEVDWFNSSLDATIGQLARYSDRKFDEEGLDGRILQVDNIEDILNVSKNGTSQSVTLTLDDGDGALKQIFNNTDIHKKRVWIYQWFSGLPITEKFLLFSGIVASPIVWSEGARTLTFSVISKGEDVEIGFSPEEGEFPTLPQNMVGTVWPLVFGEVAKLPFQRVDEISFRNGSSQQPGKDDKKEEDNGSNASPVIKEGTGIADPSLKKQIDLSSQQASEASRLAQLYFLGYLQASGRARRAGELPEFSPIQVGKGPWSSLAKQYLDAGNNMLLQGQQLRTKSQQLTTTHNTQKSHEKKSIGVTYGEKMPQGKKAALDLGEGAIHSGYFLGNSFVITGREHPMTEKYEGMNVTTEPTIARETFFYADAGTPLDFNFVRPVTTITDTDGTPIVVEDNNIYPVRYIVSSTIPVTVTAVFARRTQHNITGIYLVPPTYYEVVQVMFGTLPVTALILRIPLSARGEGWDDELWGTVTSTIGPNTVDILQWIIETYTNHVVDATSFAEVRALLEPYPSNFSLQTRPQVMSVLAEIAYQARCIIWLKDNTFYLKYLAKKDTPVATITEADIVENTMEISCTETEDLTTKYIAEWVSQYKTGARNLTILRYNIAWYGTNEKRYSYFIYTQQQLVEKSATFWMIREANTFKLIKFTVPIKFLNIETLDTITLDFDHDFIANEPVDCVVEEAVVDTANYTITLKCWCPVRTGEMVTYTFAYLNDLDVQNVFPTDEDVRTGRAGSGSNKRPNPYNNDVKMPPAPPVSDPVNPPNDEILSTPFTGTEGNGGSLRVTVRPHTWGADPSYIPDNGNQSPVFTTRADNTGIVPLGKKPPGTTTYQYGKTDVKPTAIIPPQSTVVPGIVVSGSGEGPYVVKVYYGGLAGEATTLREVFCVSLPEDDDGPQQVPEGAAVMVTQVAYKVDDTNYNIEYTMQPATWI